MLENEPPLENQQNLEIAEILRSFSSRESHRRAEVLENKEAFNGSLDLKYLGLWSSDVERIARNFSQRKDPRSVPLKTVTFSYNDLLGDEGAIALADNLPRSLRELELIDCGIGDFGGRALLQWMNESRTIQTVCIEANDFSKEMKDAFRTFSDKNQHILVVF